MNIFQKTLSLFNLNSNLNFYNPRFLLIFCLLIAILSIFTAKTIAVNMAKAKVKKRKRALFQQRYRSFLMNYHIREPLDNHFNIDLLDSPSYPNRYTLVFPYWLYANANGSKNKRYSHNRLIRETCYLYVDGLIISCPSPIDMVSLVNYLRQNGCDIDLNLLEKEKLHSLITKFNANSTYTSLQAIIRSFESRPTDFECFCADLFKAMGFQTQVTSRTNDGGFDILMEKDQITYVVECKCFSAANPVGRPLLQKLVGANSLQHADVMVFITTSTFSKYAAEYGEAFNMWLIDGSQLLQMLQSSSHNQIQMPSITEYPLTLEDLMPYYPPDV